MERKGERAQPPTSAPRLFFWTFLACVICDMVDEAKKMKRKEKKKREKERGEKKRPTWQCAVFCSSGKWRRRLSPPQASLW